MSRQRTCATQDNKFWHGTVVLQENVRTAKDTYRIRFACPQIARRVLPGQFLMIRLPDCNDPLLGRPLAIYNVLLDPRDQPHSVDIVFLVVGKMTGLLAAAKPGQLLEVWGPLGNGFPPRETEHLVMVAGGIGQTPFLPLAQEYLGERSWGDPPRRVPEAKRVTLCYGVRNKDYLSGIEDFQGAGVEVHTSTDDGSAGHHGPVTDLLRPVVEESSLSCLVVCCGPEPMMKATAEVSRELGLDCQVSLETPMACGMGVCFSCVTRVRDESGEWDYRRTCVDGPVFDAQDIEFP